MTVAERVGGPAATARAGRQPWPKTDAFAFVSGGATYLDDVASVGTLHMAVVRSAKAHARLLEVDLAPALAMDGVVSALAGDEAARLMGPVPYVQDPAYVGARAFELRALAVDEVRWIGEPVAVVVAETSRQARAGAAAVAVRYAELPVVVNVEDFPAAPKDLETEYADRLLARNDFDRGDTDGAFAAAPYTLQTTVTVGRSTTAPLEPRGYLASWDPEGAKLTVHTSHQQPFQLRWELAAMLRVPEEDVRVIVPQVGGSFGLKMTGFSEESLVCLMSRLCRRPVKFVETRAECFLGGGREQVHHLGVAFDEGGRILALRNHIVIPVGAASASPGWRMAYVTAASFPGGYDVPNVEIRSRVVLTNRPPWHSCRGYGKDDAIVVMERAMDMVARRLGADPADVRRANLLSGDAFPHRLPSGYLIDSGDFPAVFDRALALADYRPDERGPADGDEVVEGVGIAFEITPEGGGHPSGPLLDGALPTAPAPEAATVAIDESGLVVVRSGVTNPGGGNDTALAALAAAELGLTRDAVTVIQGDTDLCPPGTGHASSRATAIGGPAVVLAARELALRLRRVAAARLDAPLDAVALRDGRVEVGGRDAMPLPGLCRIIHREDPSSLAVTRTYVPTPRPGRNDTEDYRYTYPYVSSGAYVARVLVDRLTGKVRITGLVAVHDCGRVINHTLVEGQMHGAMAMGAGLALFEESLFDDSGELLADSFKTYLAPRANDLPSLTVEHHETLSPSTLLGSKGAGEAGVGGTMAALVNAVMDAVARAGGGSADGAMTVPLTPPRVLELLPADEEANR